MHFPHILMTKARVGWDAAGVSHHDKENENFKMLLIILSTSLSDTCSHQHTRLPVLMLIFHIYHMD